MNPFDSERIVTELVGPVGGRPCDPATGYPKSDGRRREGEPPPNPQLYVNSPLCGSQKEQDYKGSPDALWNDRDPNLRILHEKPEHRVLIYLKAQGLSNTEIAQRTGFQLAWIGQVLRQPWARERIVAEMKAAGQDAVSTAIKSSALDSVYTLINERDNEKAKPSERIAAANALLDRFLGKPTQKIESQADVTHHDASTVEEIDRQLATLRAEERHLTGQN